MDVLPDILAPNLKVVFCGMAAGKKSAEVGAYYAGPGNKFWPILYQIGLTPCQLEPHQFREVLAYGIGLTDIEKRQSGSDDKLDLSGFDPEDLRVRIMRFKPRILAFVGKRAAQEFSGQRHVRYGLRPEPLDSTAVFVLPSTSGAARRYWDKSYWYALAAAVAELDRLEG
jgi:TDG/mug DNA glycosylase family protein